MSKTKDIESGNNTSSNSRVRKIPPHRSFRITKKRFKHPTPIPSPLTLFRKTFRLIGENKLLFFGIVATQSILSFLLVQGISGYSEIGDLKDSIQELFGESSGLNEKTATGLTLFGYLAASTNKTSGDVAGVYQLFIAIIISLAVIWTVRQLLAGETPTLRDVFYKAMYPLIPFMIVLLVIGFQLIPALIGNLLYSTVISNGLAVSSIEQVLWFMIFVLLLLLSAYLLASSLFGLYIVTLPDMTPLKALRSARQLVLHRRISVLLRLVSLPVVILVFALLIFVPILIVATAFAQPLFIIFSSLMFVVTHTYMYHLYRSLL